MTYCYSFDGETFFDGETALATELDAVDEAINDAAENVGQRLEGVYIGKVVPLVERLEKYLPRLVEELMDQLRDAAFDEIGDHAANIEFTQSQRRALADLIKGWAESTDAKSCFAVGEPRRLRISSDGRVFDDKTMQELTR